MRYPLAGHIPWTHCRGVLRGKSLRVKATGECPSVPLSPPVHRKPRAIGAFSFAAPRQPAAVAAESAAGGSSRRYRRCPCSGSVAAAVKALRLSAPASPMERSEASLCRCRVDVATRSPVDVRVVVVAAWRPCGGPGNGATDACRRSAKWRCPLLRCRLLISQRRQRVAAP